MKSRYCCYYRWLHASSVTLINKFSSNLYTVITFQDPEMVREAQRMMQDPNFQLKMQQMMSQPHMQHAIQTTQQTISDPYKRKQLEIKTKLALADGEKKLAALQKEQEEHKLQQEAVTVTVNDNDNVIVKDDGETNDTATTTNDELSLQDDIPDMPVLNLN